MAQRPTGIEIKTKSDDAEGDTRARLSGFDVMSIRVIIGEKHIERCFYDNCVLEKITNIESRLGYASYRCPDCLRAYIMPVSEGEMKKLRRKGKVKQRKGRRFVDKNGVDNRMYFD